jgi:diguanylate cyclase (GGDEF)-like protein/PAS domain S-box-containing protein
MDAKEHGDRPGHRPDHERRSAPLPSPDVLIEGLPDAVVVTAPNGRIRLVNAVAEELFGYRRDELIGEPVQILWAERARERYTRNMQLYFATEHPVRFSTEVSGRRRDGSEFVGEMSWGIVQTSDGPLLLAVGRDVSRHHAAEARSRGVASVAERALAGAGLAELAEEAVDVMRAALPLTGAAVVLRDGSIPASVGAVRTMSVRVPIGAAGEVLVAPARDLDEDELDLVSAMAGVLATALARMHSDERMRHEAVHDALTGLANRTLLHESLRQAILRAQTNDHKIAVFLIDIDWFKQINDSLGHANGDVLLATVGQRLLSCVRESDTVARMGGDEFVIVMPEIRSVQDVEHCGEQIIRNASQPIEISGRKINLTLSVGVAVFPEDGHAVESLLRNADAAMYAVKDSGRNSFCMFHQNRMPTRCASV